MPHYAINVGIPYHRCFCIIFRTSTLFNGGLFKIKVALKCKNSSVGCFLIAIKDMQTKMYGGSVFRVGFERID